MASVDTVNFVDKRLQIRLLKVKKGSFDRKVRRQSTPDQKKLTALSSDSRLTNEAEKIIDLGSCAVAKPVRAGFTTSAVYACDRKGLKLLVLEPTTRLLKETIGKASNGNYIRVTGNSECPIQEEEARKNKVLKKLPFILPDCTKCKMFKTCPVLEINRVDDFNVVGLTYAKLESLMLSNGKIAKDAIRKISSVGIVLLDEAHLLSLPSPPSIPAFSRVDLPDSKYRMLDKILSKWHELCGQHTSDIQGLTDKARDGFASQHLSIHLSNPESLSWKDLKVAWSQLRKLAIDQDLPDNEILVIRDIITILASSTISLNFISENDSQDGKISVTASQTRQGLALSDFLRNQVPFATHLYASGTLFEPYHGFFAELSGKEIKSTIFPDLRNATSRMTLIPDKRKLRAWDFKKDLSYIVEMIKTIAEREKQPIYVLAPNRAKKDLIKAELAKSGVEDIFMDYFRSDYTLGVERTERVCVSIGMADTPANSCDFAVYGTPALIGESPDDKWIQSRKLRRQCVDSATWQAINRVKDPEGKTESRVYFVGSRLDRVKQVARWGINRTVELQEIREDTYTHKNQKQGQGQGNAGGTTYTVKVPVLDVHVDQELELPKIFGEAKHGGHHSDRRSVADYIKKIESSEGYYSNLEKEIKFSCDTENNEKYDSNLEKDEKSPKNSKKPIAAKKNRDFNSFFSNIYYRENGAKVPIFNNPGRGFQQHATIFCLFSWFVNRIDHYGLQYFNPAGKTKKEILRLLEKTRLDRRNT